MDMEGIEGRSEEPREGLREGGRRQEEGWCGWFVNYVAVLG